MTMFSDGMLLGAGGGAITYTFVGISQGTSFPIAKPAGTVDGDFMVAFFNPSSASTSHSLNTRPAGWANALSRTNADGENVYIDWKQASGEPANYTWSANGAPTFDWITLATWRGPTAIDAQSASVEYQSSGATQTLTSITAANDGMLVALFGSYALTPTVTTGPAGMNFRGTDGINPPHRIYDLLVSPAGATGTKAITWAASNEKVGALLQLR